MSDSPIRITTIQETDDSIQMDHPSSLKLSDMIFKLLKGKSLQEIIDFGYKLLGNPPLLAAEGALIASPPNCEFANSTFLDMLQRTDPGCREPLFLITEQEFKEKQQRSDAPLLVDCKHLGLRLIAAKVLYHGATVAVLQLPESERSFGSLDILYVHILAQFISSELANPGLDNEFSDMLFRTKFLDLLENGEALSNLTWVHLLQEKESPVLCICVLRLNTPPDTPPADILNTKYYFCRGVSFQKDYVFLCTISNDQQRQTIRTHFASVAKKYGGTVGISAEFTDSERILIHYRQAKVTLEAGFASRGINQIHDFEQTSINTILFDVASHIKTRQYFDPTYSHLRDSDHKKGTDLCHTLEKYLAFNGDKAQVCQSLQIHRNTLGFRLHCIESILGWRINEDTSFYMLKIMEQLRHNQELLERVGEQWNMRSRPLKRFQPNS